MKKKDMKWLRIKLTIKFWWINLFSEHKVTPRYPKVKVKPKRKLNMQHNYELAVLQLNTFEE